MLYKRNYRVLTEDEKKLWEEAKVYLYNGKTKGLRITTPESMAKYYEHAPVAAIHYEQLFPNNYLNIDELDDKEKVTSILSEFKQLLDSKVSEREVLSFISNHQAYYIIGSILNKYNFGHHVAFAFKEFDLASIYRVDYLLVGKNSGGYEFVFVELENPSGDVTTKNGDFGQTIRKGIAQTHDWDLWLESNYLSLRTIYCNKYLSEIHQLPREFYELDKSRIHYVVVAGRRDDYKEKTYTLRRRLLNSNSIRVLHYDNLIDFTRGLLERGNY